MEVNKKWPFYIKFTSILLSIICLSFIAVIGQEIFIPLILGFLISILLVPICNFLEKYLRFPRTLSSIVTTLLFAAVILGLLYLITVQLADLANEWPTFQKQTIDAFNDIQQWIHHTFGVNSHKQIEYLSKNIKTTIETSTVVLEKAVKILLSMGVTILFTFLYIVFLLIYRRHLVKFLFYSFDSNTHDQVYNIVMSIQKMVKQYLIGLFLQMIIVSVLAFIAFSILGIKYSFILAILTGVLNIIPYVGITISLIVTLIITFTTMSASNLFFVIIAFVVVHMIDGNIVMPKIVGSKVKVNSLIIIIGLVIGEMAWGILGMLLSIPIIALIKIVFDNIEELKPWGYLLGDDDESDINPDVEKYLAYKNVKKKSKLKKNNEESFDV